MLLARTTLHSRSRSGGMTLVEMVMAATLFVAFASSVFLAVDLSSASYRTETVSARLDSLARETMDELSERLRGSDFDSITPEPQPAPASASSIDFQRSRGFAGGGPTWGPTERVAFEYEPADPDDGVDNDDDGLIDEGRLVWFENPELAGERRTVLCSHVSEALEGELPGNALDDNGNGLVDERGFCLEFVDDHLVARITLEDRDHEGRLILHSSARAVKPRNTPEE
jgi:hypothetical protein